jgi:acetyl esterase
VSTQLRTDVADRLDPVLRQFASARTDLAPDVLPKARESLNVRRRERAEALDDGTTTIDDDFVLDDRGHSIPIRIYRADTRRAPGVI